MSEEFNDCNCAHCYEPGDADWICSRGIEKNFKNVERICDIAESYRKQNLELKTEIERLSQIIKGHRGVE